MLNNSHVKQHFLNFLLIICLLLLQNKNNETK